MNPPGESIDLAHPELSRRLHRVHARHPFHANDVFRPPEDQELFWNCRQEFLRTRRCPAGPCQRSGCASANRPGQSNHERRNRHTGAPESLAADIRPLDGDWGGLLRVCREEGLAQPIRSSDPNKDEPWHQECAEIATGRYVEGSEDRLPRPPRGPDPAIERRRLALAAYRRRLFTTL